MSDPNYDTATERAHLEDQAPAQTPPASDPAPAATPPAPDADVRAGPIWDNGDPKDNPVLPDDVSETADPEDPTKLRQPAPAEESRVSEGQAQVPPDAPVAAPPAENG